MMNISMDTSGGVNMNGRKTIASAKPTRKQAAYEYIKEKILSCEYEPGSLMNEQHICDELELSRTPVRDALSRLEQEGLINIMPKKGIIVSDLKLDDINGIYEVRLLLEPYALRHYGNRLDQKQLEHFQTLMSDFSRAQQDTSYLYGLDDQFHCFIMNAVQNRYLIDAYENINNLNRRLRVLSGTRIENRIADTFQEHASIIEACLGKDWERAAQAMAKHLETARIAAFRLLTEVAWADSTDSTK